MSLSGKILPQHLARQAFVYIRQSTPRQVEEHLESQDLQYQLVQRAQTLGWPPERVHLIDDDLGKSAVSSAERQGFQALVAAVGLAQVGIILVTDVSRLARNCTDWYRLLDLASLCGTLISDASGIYDPRSYDDRLLLGLKGTFSEAQWHSLRSQLTAALFNKARRGELATRLPVGYDRLADGQVVLTPDIQVQEAIRLVFTLFCRLGSAHRALHYCHDHGIQLPRRVLHGPAKGTIAWLPASYQAIYHILRQPAYAGAYAYGKQQALRLPGAEGKVRHRRRPMEEWIVLKTQAFAGYITWDEYLANQRRLHENAQGPLHHPGAPREGVALLQGIVYCARCGRPMRPRYRDDPAYVCEANAQAYGEPRCQRFTVAHVDQAIAELFLRAVEPASLEVALAAVTEREAERLRLATHWQQRVDRARYEAALARRRYEQVDPDLRLVAAELERLWEERLREVQNLEKQWLALQARITTPLSESDRAYIRALAQDLPALWHAPSTTPVDRKRLLRCLIQDVTLDGFSRPGYSLIKVRWHTGATTELSVSRPKPGCRTPQRALQRIRELAAGQPDDRIAEALNAEELHSATGRPWTQAMVRRVRGKYRISTACPPVAATPGPRGDGLISAAEAARRLDVTPSMICDWFRRGRLVGHQPRIGAPLWVRLDPEDLARLDGSAQLTPDLLPEAQAPQALGLTPEQLREAVRAGSLLTYRLFVHHCWRWYVQRPADSQP